MSTFTQEEFSLGEKKLSVWQIVKEEVKELRWRVLFVACFLTFGSYYIFDFPGSLGAGSGATIEQRFLDHGKKYTQQMNQLLYSVYSWPNTALAVFGGLLIDKYLGLRAAMLLFSILILAGSFFFWLGLHLTSFPLMIAARIIFGLGGESLSVAQSAYVARWFKHGRGMALAFGITISFARVGSSFNFLFSPMIAEAKDVGIAAVAGIGACTISLVACIVLVLTDIYAVRIGYIKPEPKEAEEEGQSVMKFSDILRLSFAFWSITGICVFCYTALFPFIGVGKNFIEVKYRYSSQKASNIISSFQFASVASSPVVGLLVDAVGRNTLWLIFACSCFIILHLLFIFTMIPALALMIMMGIVYSFLVSGLWPSVPWAVKENIVGFSYGVMTAVQNIGLAVFPIIVGSILDRYTTHSHASKSSSLSSSCSNSDAGDDPLPSLKGYQMTEVLFIASLATSLIFGILLLVWDLRNGGILTASGSQRKGIATAKEEACKASLSSFEKVLLPDHILEGVDAREVN